MKRCSTCKQLKELSEFNKHKRKPDGLQTVCRSCYKQYAKEYYRKNGYKQRKQIKVAAKVRKNQNREKLYSYLLANPCVDCNEADVIVLEFDHLPEFDKRKNVACLVREGYGWTVIEEEIKKCEVVCCNCHRRRTSKRGGWWKEQK